MVNSGVGGIDGGAGERVSTSYGHTLNLGYVWPSGISVVENVWSQPKPNLAMHFTVGNRFIADELQ